MVGKRRKPARAAEAPGSEGASSPAESPEQSTPEHTPEQITPGKPSSFDDLGLDQRIVHALAALKLERPMPIQQAAIPLALEGRDILARARTGSGKTIAYLAPVLQQLVTSPPTEATRALILVPTRELAHQISALMQQLLENCGLDAQVLNLAQGPAGAAAGAQLQPLLEARPAVVVSTPTRALQQLQAGALKLAAQNASVVFDEADLLFSYGYSDDIGALVARLPRGCQQYLMSATLSASVQQLKSLALRNPAVLEIEDDRDAARLLQYLVPVRDDFERFLVVFFLLKLKVHPFGTGKTLVFVANVDRAYRLKLFLGQFGIRACALNAELPVASRYHAVQEFNRDVFDIMIATDGADRLARGPDGGRRRRPSARADRDYGVARGIDFCNVQAVVNFDPPATHRDHVHRVGRTARGVDAHGFALTLVAEGNADEESAVARIVEEQKRAGQPLEPFAVAQAQLDPFRYRCQDAFRAVTPRLVRDARLQEVAREILVSDKLKAHFEAHPADLAALRHDQNVASGGAARAHLRHVPDYLLPRALSRPAASDAPAAESPVIGSLTGVRGDRRTKVPFRHQAPAGKTYGHKVWKRGDPLQKM